MPVPPIRIRACNTAPVRADGDYVLYWMIAFRRTAWNFSLDRAIDCAQQLNRPLVVLEALRCNYPWASDRLHRFVLDGMADNARALAGKPVLYYPYVEPRRSAGTGLLETLARRACLVITDDFPCFFLPGMVQRVAAGLDVRMEAVDSNGLLPLRAATSVYPTAYAFRRFLQQALPAHLPALPAERPFLRRKLAAPPTLPATLLRRWPAADLESLCGNAAALADFPIDHSVSIAPFPGGADRAEASWTAFLDRRLDHYAEDRNEPDKDGASGLSPYLHFGHISAHQIFAALAARESWTPDALAAKASGKREGWWGMTPPAESFLDELVTWRELGFNFCSQRDDYDRYESLPDWARRTLDAHATDQRQWTYTLEQLANADTHDPLWNAAQRQIVREGRMHNYLRMLWGKKILEWTASPRDALRIMIELNNKFGVDGRDPNSYSGICWVLGRYDRPWGPERPIFGTIRYMSSQNTARKYSVDRYLKRFGSVGAASLFRE